MGKIVGIFINFVMCVLLVSFGSIPYELCFDEKIALGTSGVVTFFILILSIITIFMSNEPIITGFLMPFTAGFGLAFACLLGVPIVGFLARFNDAVIPYVLVICELAIPVWFFVITWRERRIWRIKR